MVNPVSSSNPVDHSQQVAQSTPKPASNNKAAEPQDSVHLRSAGDVDHDGDSH